MSFCKNKLKTLLIPEDIKTNISKEFLSVEGEKQKLLIRDGVFLICAYKNCLETEYEISLQDLCSYLQMDKTAITLGLKYFRQKNIKVKEVTTKSTILSIKKKVGIDKVNVDKIMSTYSAIKFKIGMSHRTYTVISTIFLILMKEMYECDILDFSRRVGVSTQTLKRIEEEIKNEFKK